MSGLFEYLLHPLLIDCGPLEGRRATHHQVMKEAGWLEAGLRDGFGKPDVLFIRETA
ncbi:hypothetical protein ALQ33_101310 [Pseudomonas syringae pv. philadelphi]|uniref:Uncharacterized protein n=1 Tax=Pseudomonas syringae pv. philadelphi TaxID=251706 RepID=A0A3M3Z5I3_9PSED|nr:hypothetical protein ALQ33_101310 [Pseudomonas syringae pv. philadelphi]